MRLFFHLPEKKSAKACQAYLWLHVVNRDTDQPTMQRQVVVSALVTR
jgi:hypothetical protein